MFGPISALFSLFQHSPGQISTSFPFISPLLSLLPFFHLPISSSSHWLCCQPYVVNMQLSAHFFFRQQASIRTCMSRIVALGHVTRAEWGATLRYLLCGVGWVCRGSADLCSCDGGSEECILMVFEVRFRWWVF